MRRFDSGALSLGHAKLTFVLDEAQRPVSFGSYVYRDSNKLVEEFMLLANMSVARRIHHAFPEQCALLIPASSSI